MIGLNEKEHPKRGLVVEDDPGFCDILCYLLAEMGVECDVASDASTAHRLMKASRYDVYFFDLRLPDSTGELLEFIVEREPEVARRSAIVTAYPLIASAWAGPIPIIDKTSMTALRSFVSTFVKGIL